MKTFFVSVFLMLLLCSCQQNEAPKNENATLPHFENTKGVTQLFVNDEAYIILGGELRNSSAFSLSFMEPMWERVQAQNVNTILLPLSWRTLEPVEGGFDFTLVDGLITQAREYDLKLIFLWFGAWKNGMSGYAPSWVSGDPERFQRMEDADGRKIEVFSTLSENLKDAEGLAFKTLMGHIREIDEAEQTVIMVQVENEVGIRGSSRDYSALSEKHFQKQVPEKLLSYLEGHSESLNPVISSAWEKQGKIKAGNWEDIFGEGIIADEIFMAWTYSTYINDIAGAGREAYPLPMFANAWLHTEGRIAGIYPSGGPVATMIDIWKAGAPDLVLLAPDIYEPEFKYKCSQFALPNNPLFIPEACAIWYGDTVSGPAKAFYSIAQHRAIGFSPFGIDDPVYHRNHPLAKAYEILGSLMPMITKAQSEGDIQACMEEGNSSDTLVFGDFMFIADYSYQKPAYMEGYALIIREEDNHFLIAGNGLTMTIKSNNPDLPYLSILSIGEGEFKDGQWVPGRELSGDETINNGTEGVKFPPNPYDIGRVSTNDITVQRVELNLFN